jgi:hypothetical protein
VKINLQKDQFRFKGRRNELTNIAVQFKADVNIVKDELTHRSALELQITGVKMKEMLTNLQTDQFIHYR